MRRILMYVGTSVYAYIHHNNTHWASDYFPVEEPLDELRPLPFHYWWRSYQKNGRVKRLRRYIRAWMRSAKGREYGSRELEAMRHLQRKYGEVSFHLLCQDNIPVVLAAEALYELKEEFGFDITFDPERDILPIQFEEEVFWRKEEGGVRLLKKEGIPSLLKKIEEIAPDIIDISGASKGITPSITTKALSMGIPLTYIYEGTRSLIIFSGNEDIEVIEEE